MVPCYNRAADLANLVSDIARLDRPPGVRLSVLVIDNASDPPLNICAPAGVEVEAIRLRTNRGGSGGFNAGLGHLLRRGRQGDPNEFLWLLDSDARLEPGALAALIAALADHPNAVVAGSALAHPATGTVFEQGGHVDRRTGEYRQPVPQAGEAAIEVEYVAACSMMVRRAAVERAGLMPDLFINGDDVEWCLRMAARTGGRILAVGASRARHPQPDKMRTWDRYYAARNGFAAIDRLGLGGMTRFRRGLREAARGACQALVGRDDLGALHLRGLRDALAGRTSGPAPAGTLDFRPLRPVGELAAGVLGQRGTAPAGGRGVSVSETIAGDAAIMAQLTASGLRPVVQKAPRSIVGALARVFLASSGVAIVSARARPADWSGARVVITVAPQGFAVGRGGSWQRIFGAGRVLTRGGLLSAGLAVRGPGAPPHIPPAPTPQQQRDASPPQSPAGDLTTVVLSFNRWPALRRTLAGIGDDPGLRGGHVIVVDNASADSSPDRAAVLNPLARVLRLPANLGVAGFNRGAEAADTPFILILDDDATPAPGAMAAALALLRARPDLGAVALHPRHPATGASEWPFASAVSCDDWPVMGCANLVRRDAWKQVGGYEEGFFLYRNDTDLAMKLAGAGWGVHFNPAWVVLHDSPAAAAKSARWFTLAARNWVWLCRRHGRGPSKAAAILAGWAWAHREAGVSPRAHWRVLRGAGAGLCRRPPPLPAGLRADGRSLRRLLALRLGRGQSPGTNRASMDRHSP